MESISNGVEDYLIDGLSFKLPPGSSYITDRRKSTFWASGSNAYKAEGGTRVVRFLLNGEDGTWLDPQTIRVQFDLRNEGASSLRVRPLSGPHLFFRRARVMVNGQVAEDIQDFGRNSEMFLSLMPDHVRDNMDIEGFGHRWDDHYNKHIYDWDEDTLPGIEGGKKQTVMFKPMLGLVNQSKLLPVKYAPIIIELELCNSNLDPIISPGKLIKSGDSPVYTTANTGSNWSIENICVKVDCCTLDNSLNNEYTAHLLAGKALPIKYSTLISQQSSISGSIATVQVSRAVSRLQKCFITLYKNPSTEYTFDKPSIKFYHPMETNNAIKFNPEKELEFQIQLGGKLYPEYPVKSISEAFCILKQTLNLPDWGLHSVGVDYHQYTSSKFIFGMSFEKMPEASWTGTNTETGQILLIKLSSVNPTSVPEIASTMFITLMSENILEIRDVACSVYE